MSSNNQPPSPVPARYASIRIGKRHDPEPGASPARQQPHAAQRAQPTSAPAPGPAPSPRGKTTPAADD